MISSDWILIIAVAIILITIMGASIWFEHKSKKNWKDDQKSGNQY